MHYVFVTSVTLMFIFTNSFVSDVTTFLFHYWTVRRHLLNHIFSLFLLLGSQNEHVRHDYFCLIVVLLRLAVRLE